MSKNKKLSTTANSSFNQLAEQLGMALMTAATVTGMLELPNHLNNRVVLPGQPSFVMAENDEFNNPVRREKEEVAPHFTSYSAAQRTPSRASKR